MKDQGNCGSCVAFATVGAIEATLIKVGADPDSLNLSEQWLLDCSPYGGGCAGSGDNAYSKWIPTRGVLMHEDDYPYTATADKDICAFSASRPDLQYWSPGYKIDNSIWKWKCTDEEIMMQMMQYGSVMMTVMVENGFGNYKSGVFDGCTR